MERSELTDEIDVNKVQQRGTHYKPTQDWGKKMNRWLDSTMKNNEQLTRTKKKTLQEC